MSCIIKYNGKEYSEFEFKNLLLTDSFLYEKIFNEFKTRLKTILDITKQNPLFLEEGDVIELHSYVIKSGIDVVNNPSELTVEGFKDYLEDFQDEEAMSKNFDDLDKYTIIQEIISRTFVDLDITSNVEVSALYEIVHNKFEEILDYLLEKNMLAEADFMEQNRDEILGNGVYEDSIKEYIDTELDIANTDDTLSENQENIKEHGQASYEIDITQALSAKVKLMFSGIKDPLAPEGFGGFKNNMTGKDALDALQQVMTEAKDNSLEEVRRIINIKKELNPNDLSFYDSILEVLEQVEETNPDILSQVLYNLYQSKVQMRFVMWKRQENGFLVLENYDANVKNPLFIKRSNWIESLKNNGLLDQYESVYYKINPAVYAEVETLHKRVTESFDKRKNIIDVNRKDLKDLLHYYGISLNEKTLDNIFESKTQNNFNLVSKLFDTKKSILHILKGNIDTAVNSDKKLTLNPTAVKGKDKVILLNPLTSSNSQINDLIQADNYIEFLPMGTMYIAGKTINMYQQPNPITNKTASIKKDLAVWDSILNDNSIPEENKEENMPAGLKKFLSSKITSNSMLLDLMINNPAEASEYFDTVLISLEALKESGTKSRDDMGITDLSDKDSLVTLLGIFSSSEGKYKDSVMDDLYDGQIKLRKGSINFPTLSDSSQMPILKSILLELSSSNVDVNTGVLDEHILKILKEQLLYSDLFRIADYIAHAEGESNISGYDAGALWITGLSSLNNVLVDTGRVDPKTKKPIKRTLKKAFADFIRENPEVNNTPEAIREFVSANNDVIDDRIQETIQLEVDRFINVDGTEGAMVEFELVDDKGNIKLEDGKKGGYFSDKSARLVAYDYVINNFLQQKEIQTLFAGDLAFYFKDKMAKDLKHELPKVTASDIAIYYYEDSIEEIKKIVGKTPWSKLPDNTKQELLDKFEMLKYADEFITKDINFEEQYEYTAPVVDIKINSIFKDVQNNLSKRLKGQLSPGNQFANTENLRIKDTYQIVLDDVENSSETIADMVQRTYPDVWESSYEFKGNTVTFQSQLKKFKALDENSFRDEDQETEYSELKKDLEKRIPNIAAYLKTTSTDAQEYTSWRNHLDQLSYQGRINSIDYKNIESKLIAQSKDLAEGNAIKEENKLTQRELKIAMMQPSKPLYSGLVDTVLGGENGHRTQRYVYIKSSSFPLLPELTEVFPKLNNMRKTMEHIEKNKDVTVRMTYESAVKVGAPKNRLRASDLQVERTEEEMESFVNNRVEGSSMLLPKENFYIQQDKPFKSDKNAEAGKPDRTVRATQFEKIILGDGITKITESIFPSNSFDKTLLKDLGIKAIKGHINGPQLKALYNELYKREQKILADKLFNQLGIDVYSDIQDGKPEVMEKLAKMLNKRLSNKQDKKALELLYEVDVDGVREYVSKSELNRRDLKASKAIFKLPLMMTPNSRKFESVLNSMVNKSNINLKLPGYSFPVGSQEGFDFKGYDKDSIEELKAKGLILSPNFDVTKGLQSERDAVTGKLKKAQVFIANKFKVYNQETGKYDYIDLKEFVKEDNTIDFDKLPEELLEMFSFRIPTSRHQSGAVVEIVGFLPHNMGDLMIVPKDHTVQIGEDYDIDVRYAYQYNYIKKDGKLKRLSYEDVQKPEISLSQLKKNFQDAKDSLWAETFESETTVDANDPLLENNKEKIMEIIFLQEALDNFAVDKMVHAIFKDQYEMPFISRDFIKNKIAELENEIVPKNIFANKREQILDNYKKTKKLLTKQYYKEKNKLRPLWAEYYTAYNQKGDELKVIENNIVDIYKSVFNSPDADIRNMITSVLSTDFSENSAEIIDEKLAGRDKYFSIYSPTTQRKVMKLGADGKMGIGVHSNAVTMHSILQQLDDPIQLIKGFNEEGKPYLYNIRLGRFYFDGKLGKVRDETGRRISEYLSESQNSSTDNQKLEIMGRRNENAETISVFSLLQLSGLDNDGGTVNGKEVSYASLFISQPVIQKYVELVKQLKSSTVQSFSNPNDAAYQEMISEYEDSLDPSVWAVDKKGNIKVGQLSKEVKEKIGESITSEKLYDMIRDKNTYLTDEPLRQYYILKSFMEMVKPSDNLRELQSFVNIESGGMGISYFDTIDLKNFIKKLDDLNFVSQAEVEKDLDKYKSLTSLMFGDKKIVPAGEVVEDKDYIFLFSEAGNDTYVKPSNHYSHKIMNSISLGYNMWNSIFPYDNYVYEGQIEEMLEIAGLNPGTKKAKEMQYDIVSSMKDFSYTSSRTLFGSHFEAARDLLFFDDKENQKESLGAYLVRLKNHPSGKYLFKQPFFRDLQIVIEDKTHPTIIKYNSGDMSKINNLKMYNLLERMSNSNKPLLAKKDGSDYTEADLMKDLLMYSIIADQGNGAIGFRHLLPMSLFEKYKLDDVLRNRNNIQTGDMTSIIYNGSIKAAENLYGTSMNTEGVIVKPEHINIKDAENYFRRLNNYTLRTTGQSNAFTFDKETGDVMYNYFTGEDTKGDFIRQYFQHNVDKVGKKFKYSKSKKTPFYNLMETNGAFISDVGEGTFTHFSIVEQDVTPAYVTVEDEFGVVRLYERVNVGTLDNREKINYYEEIPKLGIFGYNEYQINKKLDYSTVKINNASEVKPKLNTPVIIKETADLINKGNLSDLISTMIEDYDGPYNNLISIIQEFMPNLDSIDIKLSDTTKGTAFYRRGRMEDGKYIQPSISISSYYLNRGQINIQDAIIEELLHHITISTIEEYVVFNDINQEGEITYTVKTDEFGRPKQIPASLESLLTIYKKAFKHYVNKHGMEDLMKTLNNLKSTVESDEAGSIEVDSELALDAYRVMNVHEFIAGIFIKNKTFSNEMANTPYMKSGKSILNRFSEVLMRFFQKILPNNRRDTFSANVANDLFTFLSEHSVISGENNKLNDAFTFPGISKFKEAQKVVNAAKVVKPKKIKIEKEVDVFEHNPDSELNSDYNKGVEGYEQYRISTEGFYAVVYGKDVTERTKDIIEGEFFVHKLKKGEPYRLIEKRSGMMLATGMDAKEVFTNLRETVAKNVERYGEGYIESIISSQPDIYGTMIEIEETEIKEEDTVIKDNNGGEGKQEGKSNISGNKRQSLEGLFSPVNSLSLSEILPNVKYKC